MKILLLGKNGQVGWELQRTLAPLGEITAIDQEDLDLSPGSRKSAARSDRSTPTYCQCCSLHCRRQGRGRGRVSHGHKRYCPRHSWPRRPFCQAALIHYSTDYVFDGTKKIPLYREDKPNPLNTYGKTKLAGDRAIQESGVPHLIFRTSWVYGLRGSNFLLTILRLARERKNFSVVNDQFGAPTWCRMIAEATALVVSKGIKDIYAYTDKNRGIYNLSAAGKTTWHQFAEKILQLASERDIKCRKIIPIPSSEYKTPARRPSFFCAR
jgi:dTDP-4-dehydrorhamnose reductase